MTKNTILPLLALLPPLLQACTATDDDAPTTVRTPAVAFTAYTADPLTRADAAYEPQKTIPYGQCIGIYAYYHEQGSWTGTARPNFMWNQRAENVEALDAFVYAPLKYWPNSEADKLSFMAYYPYVESGTAHGITPLLTNDGTGLPSFSFRVSDEAAGQVDFLVSDLEADLPRSRDTEGDPGLPFNDLSIDDRVHFVFRHATAKVEFRIVADKQVSDDLARFTLTGQKVTMTNVCSEGVLQPVYDSATGTTLLEWSSQGSKHDYDCKTYEHQLLLPQTLGDDVRLVFDYSMTFKSGKTTYEYSGATPVGTDEYTYTNSVSLQLNKLCITGTDTPLTAWEPNHHYVYTIRLRANAIEFTGQVVEWGEYVWHPM